MKKPRWLGGVWKYGYDFRLQGYSLTLNWYFSHIRQLKVQRLNYATEAHGNPVHIDRARMGKLAAQAPITA